MDAALQKRLLKVLALADSSHDGEALAAVRMAQAGMNFSDLASGLALPRSLRPLPDPGMQVRALELQLSELQRRLLDVQNTAQERNNALAAVNHRVQQLEQHIGRTQTEVEKWRNLARETANKLWDIGQQIAQDRAVSETVSDSLNHNGSRSATDASFRRERRFLGNNLLTAQEAAGPSSKIASKK
jgi:septal ring factor EnvC (AmiA/AmiB activator)